MKTKNFILNNIEDDEVILWQGKPCRTKLIKYVSKKLLVLKWIFCIFSITFGVKYFEYYNGVVSDTTRKTVTLVIIICGILLAIKPLYDSRKDAKNTFYILTNKRVIFQRKKGHCDVTTYMNLNRLKNICIEKNHSKTATVYFNDRKLQCNNFKNEDFDNAVFYNVKEYNDFEKAVSSFVDVSYVA